MVCLGKVFFLTILINHDLSIRTRGIEGVSFFQNQSQYFYVGKDMKIFLMLKNYLFFFSKFCFLHY